MSPLAPRPALAALTLLAALALVVALALQYLGGLAPCHFCVLERYPYAAIAVVGGTTLLLRQDRPGLVLVAFLLLGEAGLALYHVGVERGIFQLSAGCIAGSNATTVEELRAQLMNAAPTCDRVTAAFLGLSLATWNALLALGLLALACVALVRPPRR